MTATLFTSINEVVERRSLPLADIVLDPGLQPRDGLDEETIERYANAMAAGVQLPDIVVFHDRDSDVYRIADGWHRVEAAKRLQRTSINTEIHLGGRRPAMIYALSANTEHGLPRRDGDLRRAVEIALTDEEIARESDRQIAELVRCSNSYVSRIRRELSVNSTQIEDTTRIVRRGEQVYTQKVRDSEPEPEPTEADIAIARDLIPQALRSWARPVNLGSIVNQVQKLEGGAGTTKKAVKVAIYRMIEAGNVLEVKDAYNRTAYALAHDAAVPIAPEESEDDDLKTRILDLIGDRPLELAQIRARLGIALSDQDSTKALRETLAQLVSDKQLRQVRDLYLPVLVEETDDTDDDEERDARPVGELILEALADGPMTIQEVEAATRVDAYRLRALLPGMIDAGKLTVDEDNRYTIVAAAQQSPEDIKRAILEALANGPRDLVEMRDAGLLVPTIPPTKFWDYITDLINAGSIQRVKYGGFEAFELVPDTAGQSETWLDKHVSKSEPEDQKQTQTAKDAASITDLLHQHALMPLRMKYIREMLDLTEERFTRARMLLTAGGDVVQEGESLKLNPEEVNERQPTVEEVDEANGFSKETSEALPTLFRVFLTEADALMHALRDERAAGRSAELDSELYDWAAEAHEVVSGFTSANGKWQSGLCELLEDYLGWSKEQDVGSK